MNEDERDLLLDDPSVHEYAPFLIQLAPPTCSKCGVAGTGLYKYATPLRTSYKVDGTCPCWQPPEKVEDVWQCGWCAVQENQRLYADLVRRVAALEQKQAEEDQ